MDLLTPSFPPLPQTVICIQIGNWQFRKQSEAHLKLYQPEHHRFQRQWSGSWVRPLGAGCAAEFPRVIPCSPRMGFGGHMSICKILYWFYSNIPYENSRFVFLLSCIRNFFGKALLCFNCTMQGRHVEATGL